MHIEIAERLRPFSHTPGIYFILPGSCYRVQVFPTCFRIDDLSGALPVFVAQLNMNLKGPLEQFTVEQDLERGQIRIWGVSKEGLFRYRLKAIAKESGIMIDIEKAPEQGVTFQCRGLWSFEDSQPFYAGENRLFGTQNLFGIIPPLYKPPLIDRLSLGNHKSQDWEMIRRRRDFAEILPIWHRLGQLVPKQNSQNDVGTLKLLKACQQAMNASAPEHILSHFENVFLAGFEGGLSPRLEDSDFMGILSNPSPEYEGGIPLELLSRGADLIRSLFLQLSINSIDLLPACPPSFFCGRLINVIYEGLGSVDIEWTKKTMRCMSFTAATSQTIIVMSHDGQQHCRVRQSTKDCGRPYQMGSSLKVIAGQKYWFDNFMS